MFPSPNAELTPLDFIRKGGQIATIIQCGGLWFANGKFGVTWKLVQAAVQKPKPVITGTCFIRLKKADKEKISSQVVEPVQQPTTTVFDSDGEEDDYAQQGQEEQEPPQEEVVVPAPIVPVAVVEAVIQKKKVGGKKNA